MFKASTSTLLKFAAAVKRANSTIRQENERNLERRMIANMDDTMGEDWFDDCSFDLTERDILYDKGSLWD